MALSVTRHAQISQEGIEGGKYRALACGVDTLDLGLYVEWGDNWPALHEELTLTKAKAEQEKNVLWRTFGAADSVFHPTGKPPQYRYHFEVPLGHFYLGKSGEVGNTPNAYVSISARSLWANGVAGCYRELCSRPRKSPFEILGPPGTGEGQPVGGRISCDSCLRRRICGSELGSGG
jgi:hypothetical protein